MATSRPILRLIGLFVLFVGFTGAGLAWIVSVNDISLDQIAGVVPILSPTMIAIIVALTLSLYVTDTFRYIAFAHGIGVPLPWRAALSASVANFFFSWVTPGATLGAPAVAYVLSREGIRWEIGMVIAFGKSMIGAAILLAAGFLCLAIDIGPTLPSLYSAALIWGSGLVTLFLAALIFGSLKPTFTTAFVKRMTGWLKRRPLFRRPTGQKLLDGFLESAKRAIDRLAYMKQCSRHAKITIVVTQLAYLIGFIAILAVLALQFEAAADKLRTVGASTVYLAFLYVAPTPGASGLSEASAGTFFAGLLTPAKALGAIVVFRAVTLYFQITVGIVYMAIAGGAREIVMRKSGAS